MHAPDDLLERARARVARVRGFYGHLIVYLVVNAGLVAVDLAAGTGGERTVVGLDWSYWPVVLWGMFLVADAVGTFLIPALFGKAWQERRVERYLARPQRW
jgi:hypothetical protein